MIITSILEVRLIWIVWNVLSKNVNSIVLMKLCLIYNFAQHYRTSIFKLIDQEYDCSFVFGNEYLNIKKMDYSLLRGDVTEVPTKKLSGGWLYRPGIQKYLRKDFDCYLLLGESRALSTWLFCLKARFLHPRKKVYFWSHGWYGKENRVERLLKKLFFRLPNGGVFLYGNYARELMIKEGFNPEKLYTIHNSLAYDEQVAVRQQLMDKPIYKEHFRNDYPNLFFVGRLTTIKKLDMVLSAMAQLKDKGQNYNMTFIGGGDVQEELETIANELGLNDNIWFFGPCYDEKVLGEMIYNADLCVSPGNIGLTAMHSLVFGTPAITHDDFQHQMPEFEAIREGETGTFFENGNVSSLAEKIARWFERHKDDREFVRKVCMTEIDENWTPQFQIGVLKQHLV